MCALERPVATTLLPAIGILAALGAHPAFAQLGRADDAEDQAEQAIEEIVTVETRLAEEIFDLGEPISIDAAEIARTRPSDSEALLQRLPGFSVSRPGGPGGISEVFLRGAESNFTAVYVDGIRLNDASNTRGGSADFSSLGVYDVDRIDVATGAMSAVYGADAMAGVIHIQSAWADPGTARLAAELGSIDNWHLAAGTSGLLGETSQWGIRASAFDGGDEIEGSSLRTTTLASRLLVSGAGSGAWEISLRAVQRERASFPEVSGGPELAVNRELERGVGDQLSIAARSEWSINDRWLSEINLSGARISDEVNVPAVAAGLLDGQPAFTTITTYERAQVLWVNRVALASDLQLVTGVDFTLEDGRDDGYVDLGFALASNVYSLDRSTSSIFGELGKQWPSELTTTVALRWDKANGAERLSAKLGISKAISRTGSRIWARLANGFKLPSFFALGNPLFGNPDLAIEKTRSAEIGYTHVTNEHGEISLSVYDSRYDNLVDFDFDTFTNVNRGRIDVRGIELRAEIPLAETLSLRIDGTWSDISSRSGPLRRRPERMAGVGLDWSPAQRWQAQLMARYVGTRLITSIPTGDVSASSFTLLSGTVSYAFSPSQRLWMTLDNALDEKYEDAPGFPSPGASLRVGTALSF